MKANSLILIVLFLLKGMVSEAQDIQRLAFFKDEKTGKYGVKTNEGKLLVEPKFDDYQPEYNGYAIVILNGKKDLLDPLTGKLMTNFKYENINFFSKGDELAKVTLNGKSGFIDRSFKEVIPISFESVGSFFDGRASVKEKVGEAWLSGYIDKTGKKVIPLKYEIAHEFYNGLARVRLNKKWGFIDKTGKEIVPIKYDETRIYYDNRALVVLNGKIGYVDQTGKEIIPTQFEDGNNFKDGKAEVTLNGRKFNIDVNGNDLSKPTVVSNTANDDLKKGYDAFQTKNYTEALKWYQSATAKGSERAMFNLGQMYYDGLGVPKNTEVALNYFKNSANKGWTDAMYNLGIMYYNGLGVTKNTDEGLNWLQKAADLGNENAKSVLNEYNENYIGKEENAKGLAFYEQQNYTEALKWYKMAAQKGDPYSMFNIGLMYYQGIGTSVNYPEAFNWYKKSADLGLNEAMYSLGFMYYDGVGVTKNMDEAKKWFKKSADAGYQNSKAVLLEIENLNSDGDDDVNKGLEYYNQKNYTEALKWYEKGAQKGNHYAIQNIGALYYAGEGVTKDLKKAVGYYQLAAEKNNPIANYMMAYMTMYGMGGLPQDAKKFATYFDKSLKLGYKRATEIQQKTEAARVQTASIMKEAQKSIDQKKYAVAIPLLEKAADQGNPDAMSALANIYYNTDFIKDGYMEAFYWSFLGTLSFHENSVALYEKVGREKSGIINLTFGMYRNDLGYMANLIGYEYRETDQETALRWYKRSSDNNYSGGALMVGLILYNPKVATIKKDLVLAKEYLEKAKKLGDTLSAPLMLEVIENEMKK